MGITKRLMPLLACVLLALSQAAIGRTPADYTFLDGTGREITLGSLRGRPVRLVAIP